MRQKPARGSYRQRCCSSRHPPFASCVPAVEHVTTTPPVASPSRSLPAEGPVPPVVSHQTYPISLFGFGLGPFRPCPCADARWPGLAACLPKIFLVFFLSYIILFIILYVLYPCQHATRHVHVPPAISFSGLLIIFYN